MNDLKGIIEDCNKSDLVSDKVIKKVIEIIGQEEWQILHDENNDVCTTMGELIITLEGIVELKEAKETLATMNNSMWVELEKKRAESQGITNRLHQLIKAKEIIKKLLSSLNRLTYTGLNCEECKEAEQFLSEVEK